MGVRIVVDSMPYLRDRAEQRVNNHYNGLAANTVQRDAEHSAKRKAAVDVLGGVEVVWFSEAAAIEGLSSKALAELILSKPDEAANRGLGRRRSLLAVRNAKTPGEITAVLDLSGIGD